MEEATSGRTTGYVSGCRRNCRRWVRDSTYDIGIYFTLRKPGGGGDILNFRLPTR
jgi:hypothetical protein